MKNSNFLGKTASIFAGAKDKYNEHVKNKAIKLVNQKIVDRGLKIDEIADEDYEMMVADSVKDVRLEHSKKIAQGALALFGLNILGGF